jgi:molybdenum cofactor sulfurtransferase
MSDNTNPITYLDNAGAALPPKELLQAVCDDLLKLNICNPHSSSSAMGPTSINRISEARRLILSHFGALESEYDVVFTSGATAAVNVVGLSFPWESSSILSYPMNSHTSLLGMRSYAPHLQVYSSQTVVQPHHSRCAVPGQELQQSPDQTLNFNLLLVSGECNFSGSKADLQYISSLIATCRGEQLLKELNAHPVLHSAGSEQTVGNDTVQSDTGPEIQPSSISGNQNNWLWFLDAAKLASTSKIDLAVLPPEGRPHFMCVSFYKIFGYPTGLGALLVRRDTAPILRKRYFSLTILNDFFFTNKVYLSLPFTL